MPRLPENGYSLWDLVIEKYYNKIMNAIFFYTKDQYLAKDVTQEAFAQAIEKITQLKNPDRFGAWLMSIAFNIAKNNLKRNKRIFVSSNVNTLNQLPSDFDFPQEFVERKETQEIVKKALMKLTIKEREAVILRYHLDMTEKNIAYAMGVSTGTVKKLLSRAKVKLFDHLQSQLVKEGDES
ncbi:MAG: RNA polymerase sigma factor [Bacillota bacterium]